MFCQIDLVLQKEFFHIGLNLETEGDKSMSLPLTMVMHCVY